MTTSFVSKFWPRSLKATRKMSMTSYLVLIKVRGGKLPEIICPIFYHDVFYSKWNILPMVRCNCQGCYTEYQFQDISFFWIRNLLKKSFINGKFLTDLEEIIDGYRKVANSLNLRVSTYFLKTIFSLESTWIFQIILFGLTHRLIKKKKNQFYIMLEI